MMGMMNLKDTKPEQLELFVEEEEPIPTWGEMMEDAESLFILFCTVVVAALMIFW